MTRIVLVGSLLALTAGCATSRAEKMSFEEAFRVRGTPPPASPPRHGRALHATSEQKPAGPPVATESLELESSLARFAAIAREQRRRVKTGAAMPLAQQENWSRLLASIDGLLDRPAKATAPSDVIRARVASEAELDLDARAYGDFPGELADQVLDRVTKLAVRMAELRRLQVKPAHAQLTFDWPIDPVIVTSLFGRRLHPITHVIRSHFGVDLGAHMGQLVTAAGRGTVIRAGWNGAHGQQVEIQHPGGIITRYSHLSALLVEVGTLVDRGDPVGLAGSTGLSTGPHLHFEVWKDGKPCDPLEELANQPSRPVVAGRPNS